MRRWLLTATCFASLTLPGCPNSVCEGDGDCGDHMCTAPEVPYCNIEFDECACRPDPGSGGTGGTGGSGGMSAACATPPASRFEIIGDEEFGDVDWDYTEVHTAGATVETEPTGRLTSGGVDDSSYRSMTHQIVNPDTSHPGCSVDTCSFLLTVSHQYIADGETYTPLTQGAIEYIHYSESHIITEPSFEGAAVAWTFAVWQGENQYTLPSEAFKDLEWTSAHRCRLTAEDFTPAEPALNLEDGGPITFGYMRSNSTTQPGGTQMNVHGIDDFRVVIVQK